MGRTAWFTVLLLAALCVIAMVSRWGRAGVASSREATPAVGKRSTFAGSGSCRSCHPAAYASWHRTYHRTMTQVASAGSILAPFEGQVVDEEGLFRVGHDDEGYWVDEPDARHQRVVMVTGSHHMQVYWIGDGEPHGRLRAFAYAYLLDEGRFVRNEETLLRPPAADVAYTWNRVCIKCHAVAGTPGYDEDADRVSTTVAELGIACEACHGPGREHVEANRDPTRRYRMHISADADPTIVLPSRLSAAESSAVCGRCHAISVFEDEDAWVRSGRDDDRQVRHPMRADQPWLDGVLETNADFLVERFWGDGMVRVSGREHNGLVETACTKAGFGCLTCHSMHDSPSDDQLRDNANGDEVCLDCHAGYDAQAHTHHAPGELGSGCYDCHMPRTTYGLLKAIRSHEIDSPALRTELETGRPNACNLCHLDQTRGWAADHLTRWYGHDPVEELADDRVAALAQWILAGDAGVRALAAWHAGHPPAQETSGRDWLAPLLAEAAQDDYAAVRTIAIRSARTLPELAALPLEHVTGAEILDTWSRIGTSPDRHGPTVLLDASRRVDRSRWSALLAGRDRRPVLLAE